MVIFSSTIILILIFNPLVAVNSLFNGPRQEKLYCGRIVDSDQSQPQPQHLMTHFLIVIWDKSKFDSLNECSDLLEKFMSWENRLNLSALKLIANPELDKDDFFHCFSGARRVKTDAAGNFEFFYEAVAGQAKAEVIRLPLHCFFEQHENFYINIIPLHSEDERDFHYINRDVEQRVMTKNMPGLDFSLCVNNQDEPTIVDYRSVEPDIDQLRSKFNLNTVLFTDQLSITQPSAGNDRHRSRSPHSPHPHHHIRTGSNRLGSLRGSTSSSSLSSRRHGNQSRQKQVVRSKPNPNLATSEWVHAHHINFSLH